MKAAARFFEETSVAALTSWFLVAFSEGAFDPIQPPMESARTVVLELVRMTSRAAQERIKNALVQAIAQWQWHHHGIDGLTDLVYLVSELRATSAVPVLRRHLLDGIAADDAINRLGLHVEGDPGDEEENQARLRDAVENAGRALVGVLAGFPPLPEVEESLRLLFLSPQVAPRFRASLFIGIVRCKPAGFGEYLKPLMDALDKYPHVFSPPAIARQIVRELPPSTIFEELVSCSDSVRRRFLTMLTSGSRPALILDTKDDVIVVRTCTKQTIEFKPRPKSTDYLWRTAYQIQKMRVAAQGTEAVLQNLASVAAMLNPSI
ncbi:MAG TPA: hypothetical protein VH417_06140 [Vicinamibacterales bacterium]|jgi:hypothetical protein